ncbi:MAG: amidohydrolase family protein, partial [Candidatus Korarchaeota archaeon]|nr:amidohydrolase family protein [Candidatus Korarchaeota archaeon]
MARIGDLSGAGAERTIDAQGLVVAPGFIDIHNHSDLGIFAVPTADNYVRQGVTTLVIGNCGFSPAPITELNKEQVEKMLRVLGVEERPAWATYPEYLDALDELEKSVNVAPLIGHNTVRGAVMGMEDRAPRPRELREMRSMVEEAMRAGAWGLSTGLIYLPGTYADTREIIELARPVGRAGGLYATHMRNEGETIIDAVMEAIRIGLETGAAVEISHLKVSGRANWGKMSTVLGILEDYARRLRDISADAYAYTASSTSLSAALPPWALEGGPSKLLERLRDPVTRERMRRELEREGLMSGRRLLWDDISISYSPSHPEYEGKKLSRLAEEHGMDPFDLMAKLLLDDEAGTGMIIHGMNEEEVRQ